MKTDRIPLKQQKEYWHIISTLMGIEMAQWFKEGIVLAENLNLLSSPHVRHLKTTYNCSCILLQPLWVPTPCGHILLKEIWHPLLASTGTTLI